MHRSSMAPVINEGRMARQSGERGLACVHRNVRVEWVLWVEFCADKDGDNKTIDGTDTSLHTVTTPIPTPTHTQRGRGVCTARTRCD